MYKNTGPSWKIELLEHIIIVFYIEGIEVKIMMERKFDRIGIKKETYFEQFISPDI